MTFLSIFCNLGNDYSSENSHGPFGYGARLLGNEEEAPSMLLLLGGEKNPT